jgi:hypothetical protein
MESKEYSPLGTGWKDDDGYKCCKQDSSDTPCCDCCYDSWTKELKEVNLEYNKVNEEAKQLSEKYKLITEERDKLKSWLDDLDKADQLVSAVCSQFQVMDSQTEKICINSEKSAHAIEILFCMIRDIFEQVDLILTIYNQIDNCIKCLNSEYLPEGSGIRKCLSTYLEKLQAVIKTRTELIKAIMKAIHDVNILHEGICSEYGLVTVLDEWLQLLNCAEESSGSGGNPGDPCADKNNAMKNCALIPKLTLPIHNDSYYLWVKNKYEADKNEAQQESKALVEINKKKETISACQSSLTTAINEVNPKDLCK